MYSNRKHGWLRGILLTLATASACVAASFAPANYYSEWAGVPYQQDRKRAYGEGTVSYSSPGTDVTNVKLYVEGQLEATFKVLIHTQGTLYTDYTTWSSSSVFVDDALVQVETVAFDGNTEIAWDSSNLVM